MKIDLIDRRAFIEDCKQRGWLSAINLAKAQPSVDPTELIEAIAKRLTSIPTIYRPGLGPLFERGDVRKVLDLFLPQQDKDGKP